ncbi:hypothetical protein BASA60_008575 [Batrachochytrium salamandrivorans]|nr:hypothetical protein BASA60_008575 [Batrachochytrium salamandrivorans]
MERTVVLLKPSAVPRAENIIRHLKHAGYKIIQSRSVHLSEEQATDLFQEDLDTPNFTKHISYLTSGPVIAMLVQKHHLFEEISSFIDSERSDIDPSLDPKLTPRNVRKRYTSQRHSLQRERTNS